MNSMLGEIEAARDERRPRALLVLAAAQGLALFLLHQAAETGVWPATQLAVLVSLYLLVVLLPLTAQLLARFLSEPRLWLTLSAMGVMLVLFGWHFAVNVVPEQSLRAVAEHAFPSAFVLLVLWLVVIAFLRAQLESHTNAPSYRALFAAAWRNKLTLLEAAIFTGVFWLLLWLWGALFRTLDIDLFAEVFSSSLFIYAATALVLGLALYWIGSVDRLVDVVLVQVLSLFKWLAPLAGLIVVLFAFALLPALADLFGAGQPALRALWLFWLVAVTVLLLNAAYRDGTLPPYGRLLATSMRVVPPLLLFIALVATYALYVRVSTLGLTVSRFWGLVTAFLAVAHAAAATAAAVRRGPWFGLMSKTNPLLAAVLATTLALALTPALSPHRLAANSQAAIASATDDTQRRTGALSYLRFNAGEYGRAALSRLAEGTGEASELAAAARDTLERSFPAFEAASVDFDEWWATVRVYPVATAVPPELLETIRLSGPRPAVADSPAPHAVWLDVTAGPELELLLFGYGGQYELFMTAGGTWRRHSTGFVGVPFFGDMSEFDAALARGDFSAQAPELREIVIGDRRITLQPQSPPPLQPRRD
jgi:hypothetical protein